MDLDHIQRSMFDAVRQPLTAEENMRQRTRDGRSLRTIAEEIIKPNDRLTSFERLEIYNRQYWFRVLAALAEDFEGLRLIIGDRQFRKALHRLSFRIVRRSRSRCATWDRAWNRGCVRIPSSLPESKTSRSTWCAWNGRRSKPSTRHRSRS